MQVTRAHESVIWVRIGQLEAAQDNEGGLLRGEIIHLVRVLRTFSANNIFVNDAQYQITVSLSAPPPSNEMLDIIPPELLLRIATSLPLFAKPSTLLSLALTNRRTSRTVQSLIWTELILKEEERARWALEKIAEDPQKGRNVTGIYIRLELTEDQVLNDDEEKVGPNVLTRLRAVVDQGFLPKLERLEIHLDGDGWVEDPETGDFRNPLYPGLHHRFWESLKEFCPKLSKIALTGVKTESLDDGFDMGDGEFPEMVGGMLDFKNITSFTLEVYEGGFIDFEETLKSSIGSFAPRLEELSLGVVTGADGGLLDMTPLLQLNYPNWDKYGVDVETFMSFWKRHPTLESIKLQEQGYFSEDVTGIQDFLPNLKHLTARIKDVRMLVSLLHRLTSLSIYNCLQAQVAYLFRTLLSEGLPQLRSLTVNHIPDAIDYEEGSESTDENSSDLEGEPGFGGEISSSQYLDHVAHTAPNLEEFAWNEVNITEDLYELMKPHLSTFTSLKRFFYPEVQNARKFAEACPSLETVGRIYGQFETRPTFDYPLEHFIRDRYGTVVVPSENAAPANLLIGNLLRPFQCGFDRHPGSGVCLGLESGGILPWLGLLRTEGAAMHNPSTMVLSGLGLGAYALQTAWPRQPLLDDRWDFYRISNSSRIPQSSNEMLDNIPPELLLRIATSLPLFAKPSTLLSLALTNRRTSRTVQSLIWTELILKDEERARLALGKIAEDPQKGRNVTGIYIRSELTEDQAPNDDEEDSDSEGSDDDEDQVSPNVLTRLQAVVNKGYLPKLQRLEIHLDGDGWVQDPESSDFRYPPYPGLQLRFWESLKEHCPKLCKVALTGVKTEDLSGFHMDDGEFPEMVGGMLDFKNITSFTLEVYEGGFIDFEETLKSSIGSFAPRLEELNLGVVTGSDGGLLDMTPLLQLNYPVLKSIYMRNWDKYGVDVENFMSFWKRHPTLESIKLQEQGYFSEDVAGIQNFLPNLKHLTAPFKDVRMLVSLLHQLTSLSIYDSLKSQVPYLFCTFLPEGLPHLKSLTVNHLPGMTSQDIDYMEGEDWTDESTSDLDGGPASGGEISSSRYLGYVAGTAPNLEEFAWIQEATNGAEDVYEQMNPHLPTFTRLKRFFYHGELRKDFETGEVDEAEVDYLMKNARKYAEACPLLETVGEVVRSFETLSDYPLVRIIRDRDGGVVDTRLSFGHGMEVGQEDKAYPRVAQGQLN
ncbi:hypothetical protein FA15DRAFT_658025 [Coprinopsis marcescibilis]|uniref:Uncharacterized protein n=1 Tax=Coprinopsis marcescibilis TaxID=230819 RepID=A0A5C3KPQ0_COPMA|nr:hypothetical protein FA15DRAFT_658025 [Coprinopsis marcescibilis]